MGALNKKTNIKAQFFIVAVGSLHNNIVWLYVTAGMESGKVIDDWVLASYLFHTQSCTNYAVHAHHWRTCVQKVDPILGLENPSLSWNNKFRNLDSLL